MNSIPNNSKNLNQTRPHPPITDFRSERLRQRMSPSMNYIDRIKYHHHESRSIEHHHPKFPQSIEHHHLHTIESQSILAGGVGRVRSQFLEFGDDY
jgi:hypothetical protein